jgi:lipopolysaccharide export system protein LptA
MPENKPVIPSAEFRSKHLWKSHASDLEPFVVRRERRRRWTAWLLAAGTLIAALGIVAIYVWRRERPEPVPTAPPPLPSNTNQRTFNYTFTRSDRGQKVFTIHAARTLGIGAGGETELEDVMIEVFGRAGDRHDLLRTDRASYDPRSGEFASDAIVEIELNVPSHPGDADEPIPALAMKRPEQIHLRTSHLTYQQKTSQLLSEAPVQFRFGAYSGSALGMKYAAKAGSIELDRDVRIEMQPAALKSTSQSPHSGSPVHLRAAHLWFDNDTHRAVLAGPIEVTQGAERVNAGRALVTLNDRNRANGVNLGGGVRATESSCGGSTDFFNGDTVRPCTPDRGNVVLRETTLRAADVTADLDPVQQSLRRLTARGEVVIHSRRAGGGPDQWSLNRLEGQQVELQFRGKRSDPQQGSATGHVLLTSMPRVAYARLAATSADKTFQFPGAHTFAAERLFFSFAPGMKILSSAHTDGPGKLVLSPADPKKDGPTEVTADRFIVDFDPRGRAQKFQGDAHATVVSQPPPGSPPGTGPRESSSDRLEALFDPTTGGIRGFDQTGTVRFHDDEHSGKAERAQYSPESQLLVLTGSPEISDPNTRIRAERIELHSDTRIAEGIGSVKSTHFENASRTANAGSPPRTLTPTTNVLADRVLARGRDLVVHYQGHVRAWRGGDVIESSSLDYDGKRRELTTNSSVLTSALAPSPGTEAGQGGQRFQPFTVRANSLAYAANTSGVDYRGNVIMNTQGITMLCDHLTAILAPAGSSGSSKISSAIGQGHVHVTQPGRRASGENARYSADTGKIVLEGGQPALYDEEKGLTTGKRLTFFLQNDRVLVDGGDQSPTISKHRMAQ